MAEKSEKSGGIVETIKTVVYALLIAGVFRTLFFQPFWIPSGSMKETLLIGDFLFVNKMAYGYSYASCPSIPLIGVDAKAICGWTRGLAGEDGRIWGGEPERGDVVVFRHPVHGSDYIKRLIGLPGDTVQVTDGQIILNGEPVPQKPDGEYREIMERQGSQGLAPRCENGPVGFGAVCAKGRKIETLPSGRSYPVLNIRNQRSDNTGIYTVPEGHYFFMGDNRDNSLDSRVPQGAQGVGYVPFENLIGRADRIMFSSAGASMLYVWTWRGDRYFKGIE